MELNEKAAKPIDVENKLKLEPINNPKVWTFQLAEEPEILVVIESGHKDKVHYFWEDAYGIEPWRNGMNSIDRAELEAKFEIKLT